MNCEEYVVKRLELLEVTNDTRVAKITELENKLKEVSTLFEVLEENILCYEPSVESAWNWNSKLEKRNLTPELFDKVENGDEEAYKKMLECNFGRVDEENYDYKIRFINKNKLIKLYHDGDYYSYDFDENKHFKNETDAYTQLKVDLLEQIEYYNRNYRERFGKKED